MAPSEATANPDNEYHRREDELSGWKVSVASYKIGGRYRCVVDNVSPGAWLARGEGATREEAEAQAVAQAKEMLGRTRRFPA